MAIAAHPSPGPICPFLPRLERGRESNQVAGEEGDFILYIGDADAGDPRNAGPRGLDDFSALGKGVDPEGGRGEGGGGHFCEVASRKGLG